MKLKRDHRSKFSNLSNWKEEAWKKSGILCISHCSESDSVSNRDFKSAVSTAPRFLFFFSFVGELTKTSARPNAGQDI